VEPIDLLFFDGRAFSVNDTPPPTSGDMASASYYRDEAARCRQLAEASPNSPSAPRWRKLAAEYEILAESVAETRPVPHAPMREQEVQQQQTKAEPKKTG
jgi:hypothetical protein